MRRILLLIAVWLTASSFTIHLCGDSTMAEKDLSDGKPERGWGMMFQNFLDEGATVVNYAQNGRRTKSFIDKGLWDKVLLISAPPAVRASRSPQSAKRSPLQHFPRALVDRTIRNNGTPESLYLKIDNYLKTLI